MERTVKTKNGSMIILEEIYDQQALEGLKQLNKYCEEYYGEILKKYEEYLHKRQENL